jgi:8-oxo-dGTP pyrophosphatase MutT (NUDIX family)
MQNRFSLYSAVYLILVKDEKVLLLRRFQTGWEDGKYTLISGHLDGNESVASATSREALEEAGIVVDPNDLEVVHTMHQIGNENEYIDFYLVPKNWEGVPSNVEVDKCDDMQWFALDDLPDNLLPVVRVALEKYKNSVTFSEYRWE